MTVPERAPITAKVDVNGTYYTDRLLQAKIITEYGRSSQAEIFLDNFDYALNSLFAVGQESFIEVSKGSAYTDTKLFGGIIGNIKKRRIRGVYEEATQKDYNILHIRCGDYTDLLRRLLVQEVFSDPAGSGWDTADIIKNANYGIIQKYGEGITTNNVVATTGLIIKDIRLPYLYPADVLKQLGEASIHNWYVDADKDLHFFAEETIESGETIDSDTLIGQFQVGTEGDQIRNHVVIIGGDERQTDTSQSTSTNSDSLHDNYWADEFTPFRVRLSGVQLFIEKIGSPASDLYIEVREDNSNKPTGDIIAIGFESKERIAGGGGGVIRIDLNAVLDTDKTYWIILLKTGDVSNTYKWYRDASGSDTDAYSSDGTTYTVQSGTGDNHYMITEYMQKIINDAEHTDSVATYGRRSYVLKDASIMDRVSSEFVMDGFLQANAFAVETIEGKIFPLDSIIAPGAKVAVEDTPSGIDANYIMRRQIYDIVGVGALEIDVTLERKFI